MPRRSAREAALAAALDAACRDASTVAHVARDPVRFPRRYTALADVEAAAVFAAQLAFGRVTLFGPVLEGIFAEMDAAGGPAAWCAACAEGAHRDGPPVVYRWFTRRDFVALGVAIGRVQREAPLADAFPTLAEGVARLRDAAPSDQAGPYFRTWFAVPGAGSACKRWCMFLRWMVRREAPDLGVWTHLRPADLVMPIDTHVLRIAQLTGLTDRRAADWATALEVTARLRAFAPEDPVRYDFALAHLGISDGCTGARAEPCVRCGLRAVCRVWRGARDSRSDA